MGSITLGNGLDSVDIARAQEIAVRSDFIGNIDGIIDSPSPHIKSWRTLQSRGRPECKDRQECTGCGRITKLTSGVVAVIYEHSVDNPIGAFCASTDTEQPYKPIYFVK